MKNEENKDFFSTFSPKIKNHFIIELYSFIVGLKVVRNVILNNIDLHDQPFRMHRSPSSCRPNSERFEKFKDQINLIDKKISDSVIECFDQN